MGLFFKRKKEAKMDVPPPPPEGEAEAKEGYKEELAQPGIEGNLPELPSLELEKETEAEMPEIKPVAKEEEHEKMPEFPEVPKEEIHKEKEVKEEEPVLSEETRQKFLNISSFQEILAEAEAIHDSLKQVDEGVKTLNRLKEEEEKEFQRWRTHLEGIEKKMSYVDRAIFKGE